MPTTRRSAGGTKARQGPAKGQSTISFAGNVTKDIPKDIKGNVISAPIRTKVEVPAKTEPVKEVLPEKVEAEEEELEEEVEEEVVPPKSEAELKAEKVTDAQIGKYWRAIENKRIAPRVHQQELSLNEKVLRYFDVSSQYGPCIGTQRMKRWQRADRLGLNPPVEVLAVLLKEEAKGTKNVEVAQMDRILNPPVTADA